MRRDRKKLESDGRCLVEGGWVRWGREKLESGGGRGKEKLESGGRCFVGGGLGGQVQGWLGFRSGLDWVVCGCANLRCDDWNSRTVRSR